MVFSALAAEPQPEPQPEPDAAETVAVMPLRVEEEPPPESTRSDVTRLDAMVVTAQKREQVIYDVPMAITGISGEQLAKLGAKNLRDIAAVTPSLSIVETGAGAQRIQLRGISSEIGQATVGYVLDNVTVTGPAAFQPDATTFDLASVEILRGPQGTLYGEGSMGGTIKLNTRPPKFGEWDFHGRAEHFLTSGADGGTELNAAVNVPLGETAAMRVVAGGIRHGGFVDEVLLQQENYNSLKNNNGRVRVTWLPGETVTVGALLLGQQIEAKSANGADENYQRRDESNLGLTDQRSALSLDTSWAAGFAHVFLTASGYQRHNTLIIDGREALVMQIRPGDQTAFNGTGLEVLDPLTTAVAAQVIGGVPGDVEIDADSVQSELRLSSNTSGSLYWIAGAYVQRRKSLIDASATAYANTQDVVPQEQTPGASVIAFTQNARSSSQAVFGQVEYDWTEWLNTAFGARYFRERIFSQTQGNILNEEVDNLDHLRFTAFTPRAVASFHLPIEWLAHVDNWLAYVSYAEGFRSGGANIRSREEIPPTYDPDRLKAFEIGSKIETFEGVFTAELAVFLNRWEDVQVKVFPPGQQGVRVSGIANAGTTQGLGIEWNFVFNPAPRSSVYLTGSYVDTEYIKGSDIKKKGDFVDFVPPFSAGAGASYGFNWAEGIAGSARLDYNYISVSRFRQSNGEFFASDAASFLNARLGLETKIFKLHLFGRNLLDFDGKLDAEVPERVARARPPSYGLEIEYSLR